MASAISTHRFRKGSPPKSLESKILFDSDKVDVSGAIGVARTLLYQGEIGEPIYSLSKKGEVLDGSKDEKASFFKEYKFKLEKLDEKLFTKRGREIAKERKKAAKNFYKSMLKEVLDTHQNGEKNLLDVVK